MKQTGMGLVLGLGLLAGCSPIIVGPSQMSLQQIAVSPPMPLVAQKSPRPLYIVLDPARVPDVMPVLVNGVNQGGQMGNMHLFVVRDIQRAFASYFDHVSVVAPGQAPTSGDALIVDVRLDRLATVSQVIQHRSWVEVMGRPSLNWAVGLRAANASEFIWSFAGSSQGDLTNNPQVMYQSLFEHAVMDMLKDYAQQHVQERLQAGQP
jgi:hypothetical protein